MTSHLSKVHDKKSNPSEMNLKCSECNKKIPSLAQLFSHHRKHTEKREMVQCPFGDCSFRTSVKKTYTAHICKKHRGHNIDNLKDEVRQCSQFACAEQPSVEPSMETDEIANSEVDHAESGWISTDKKLSATDLVERELLRLFVKMHVLLHVPKYAIDEIIAGINHVHMLSTELLTQHIKQVFTDNKLDLKVVNSVADCVMQEHPVYKMTNSELSGEPGIFSSAKLRSSAAKLHLPYVKPVEYAFGYNNLGKCCKFVYVPVLQSIQELLKRADILEKILHVHDFKNGVYKSFIDGTRYSQHASNDQFHLHITLYTDEWECDSVSLLFHYKFLGTMNSPHQACDPHILYTIQSNWMHD
jgi:hypothetical protein